MVEADVESNLLATAKETAEGRVKSMPDFKVRPGSQQTRQINGRAALSLVGEFALLGKPMVEYMTWVRTTTLLVQVRVICSPGEFEAVRKRIEPMVESLQLK